MSLQMLITVLCCCLPTVMVIAQPAVPLQPVDIGSIKPIRLETVLVKDKKVSLMGLDLNIASPSPALEKFCCKFFFRDTINTNITKAAEAFAATLGEPVTNKRNADAVYTYTMKAGMNRPGYYYCYQLKYIKEDDGKRRTNERNVIYDATNDRILQIEDVFSAKKAKEIREMVGKAFVHLTLSGNSIKIKYKKDGSYTLNKIRLWNDEAKDDTLQFTSHFRELIDLASIKTASKSSTDRVFNVVEQMPEFPGGQKALLKWLSDYTKYPAIAEENGIQGSVVCTFVVEPDGSITDVQVARSVDPSLDKEAVRVLKKMPKWDPGKQNGGAVRVKYTLPVTFRLNSQPEYPGGEKALNEYLMEGLRVPSGVSIKEKIILEFFVETDGSISDIKANKSADQRITEQLKRKLKRTKWKPGKRNGIPVGMSYKFVMNVTFIDDSNWGE